MLRILMGVAALCLIWVGLAITGLDRGTTIAADTVLARTVVAVVIGAMFVLFLLAYLRKPPISGPLSRIKQASHRLWVGYGVLFSALIASASGVLCDRLMRTAAQHVPGPQKDVSGIVTSLRHVYTTRRSCLEYISLASDSLRGPVTVCLESATRSAIGPRDLALDDKVRFRLVDGPLGQVIERIERER